jgi:sugar diacid utilization regulator/putative methionine-R-sulfoxide reductase with GAF domain
MAGRGVETFPTGTADVVRGRPTPAAPPDELVIADAERMAEMQDLVMELGTLEAVAMDILLVREVDQVLLSIARQTLALLESDIAGVLLRDGDRLIMRSCVGHRRARTAQLCIRSGQGVAGRVLETGEPCKVDSYLESDAISHHFDPLALAEDTPSALGVPLTAHGEVIGVLEVWRRRRSVFSDRHVRRILGLANLAAIAIENARLYDRQEHSILRLAAAEATLRVQLTAVTDAHALQRALIGHLLEGEGLPAIVRTVAQAVGGEVAVFSPDFEPVASYPPTTATGAMRAGLRRRIGEGGAASGDMTTELGDGRWLTAHEIRAGQDRLGWFCLLTAGRLGSGVALAVGEAALCCALSQLEQRAADQALSGAREQILWDLLEGAPDHRRAAISRAARLRIDLSRPHRVLHGVVTGLDDLAGAQGWDSTHLERLRRQILGLVRRVIGDRGAGDLVAIRGDTVTAIVSCTEPAALRALIRALCSELERLLPALAVSFGASGTRDDPLELRPAYTESQVALRAAQRLGAERLAIHDHLGVVRLLLASDSEANLSGFVEDVIGPVIDHDRRHEGELLKTLRAYFDADCSQQEAAKHLYVHHKTLRYRLDRIEALTSLDLRRHDHRVRADLALKILDVAELGAIGREPG